MVARAYTCILLERRRIFVVICFRRLVKRVCNSMLRWLINRAATMSVTTRLLAKAICNSMSKHSRSTIWYSVSILLALWAN